MLMNIKILILYNNHGLNILYQGNKNICCVGDDDQSIYSWRGADVSNLFNFEKNFSKTKIIKIRTKL